MANHLHAPTARPAVRRSTTWDDFTHLKARISRPGIPMPPPLPQVVDPRVTDPRVSQRKKKSISLDTTSPIITIRVGPPQTLNDFHVHRSALTQSSTFFQMKCKPEWLRDEHVIELPDHDPEAFAIYSTWLYTNIIDSAPDLANDTVQATQHKAEWLDLAHSYVLGEALLDTTFKDTIMDTIRAKVLGEGGDTIWEAAVELVQILYEGTTEGSCARKFLVDLYHYHAHPRNLEAGKKDLPRDFLFELAAAYACDTYKPAVYGFSGIRSAQCSYHCHRSGECYLEGRG